MTNLWIAWTWTAVILAGTSAIIAAVITESSAAWRWWHRPVAWAVFAAAVVCGLIAVWVWAASA